MSIKVIEVWTTADVLERWSIEVPDDLDTSGYEGPDWLQALDDHSIHEVENIEVANERDREFAREVTE